LTDSKKKKSNFWASDNLVEMDKVIKRTFWEQERENVSKLRDRTKRLGSLRLSRTSRKSLITSRKSLITRRKSLILNNKQKIFKL
jgi:hypothetical protein